MSIRMLPLIVINNNNFYSSVLYYYCLFVIQLEFYFVNIKSQPALTHTHTHIYIGLRSNYTSVILKCYTHPQSLILLSSNGPNKNTLVNNESRAKRCRVRDANKGITIVYNRGSGIKCLAFLCQIFSHSALKLSLGNDVCEVLAMMFVRFWQ